MPDPRWTSADVQRYLAKSNHPLAPGSMALEEASALQPRQPFTLPDDAPEGALQGAIQTLTKQLGYLFFHPYDSRRSTPGWPDCAIIHPDGGPLYLWELKNATDAPPPTQERWLRALERATRVDVQVYRPADLALIAARLARRA